MVPLLAKSWTTFDVHMAWPRPGFDEVWLWQQQGSSFTGHDLQWRPAIIRKVAPHVPVGAPAVQPSTAVIAVLVDINIAAAELLTRFLSSVSLYPKNSPTHEA